MTRWFASPENATAFVESADEALFTPPAGMTEVDEAAYDTVNAAREATVAAAIADYQAALVKQRTSDLAALVKAGIPEPVARRMLGLLEGK